MVSSSIGKFVFKKLSEKNIKIQSLICKPGIEEIAKKAFGSGIEIKNDIDELDDLPDLILDCRTWHENVCRKSSY